MIAGGSVNDRLQDAGSPGFVAGTAASPRVVQVVATAQLRFLPDEVIVKQGETVTFEVASIAPSCTSSWSDQRPISPPTPGTPEIADIGMMGARSVAYTFDGPGPYAFACHVTGHYEAGMAGTIAAVP